MYTIQFIKVSDITDEGKQRQPEERTIIAIVVLFDGSVEQQHNTLFFWCGSIEQHREEISHGCNM
jgi:hypothetical protein